MNMPNKSIEVDILLSKAYASKPTRPSSHAQFKCTQCNEKPLEFHSLHELQRHIDNVHIMSRKAWICIDISPSKDFLSGCENCTTQKRHGASYNAAEHLRRAHFRKTSRADRAPGTRSDQEVSCTSPEELRKWMQEVTDPIPQKGDRGEVWSWDTSVAPLCCNPPDTYSTCENQGSGEMLELAHKLQPWNVAQHAFA